MDGPAIEHSDSDSGDSWTLLENSADTPEPEPTETSPCFIENQEKEEDTDGISIISDSEPDSPTPCEIIYETPEENNPPEHETPELISVDNNPQLNNMQNNNDAFKEDLLNDNIRKMSSNLLYITPNKKLNIVLNLLILTTLSLSTCLAISHIWNVKLDCSLHHTPGANKVLSKLYQLQEENVYLRSKLKEITALYNHQANNNVPLKQNKCRKVFEGPLQNDNTEKLTMCVDGKIDNNNRVLNMHNPYEKDVQDTVNLNSNDGHNKGSINEKTAKNLKQVHKYHKNTKSPPYIYVENTTKLKYTPETLKHSDNEKAADHTESRISYADSLKSSYGKNNNGEYDTQYNEMDFPSNDGKENENKKRSKNYGADDDSHFDNEGERKFHKKDYKTVFALKEEINKKLALNYDADTDSVFDDFLKKDNRYGSPKQKKEKKNDRKKLHKREKRNKYEQMDIKDGLMKDYDDISVASSQDNAFVVKEQNLNSGAGKNLNGPSNNVIEISSDILDDDGVDDKSTGRYVKNLSYKSARELNWYENRAIMRKEARKRMEDELFNDNPPNANWYLKRMRKRDQCRRAKGDNCSYQKLGKQFKNYKTKT